MPPEPSALDRVDDLSRAVFNLKHELRIYDPRSQDLERLRPCFDEIHDHTQAIARALGLSWQPRAA